MKQAKQLVQNLNGARDDGGAYSNAAFAGNRDGGRGPGPSGVGAAANTGGGPLHVDGDNGAALVAG